MRRTAWLPAVSILSALSAAPAIAAPLYTIDLPMTSFPYESSVGSATPFRRDTTFDLLPSSGTGAAAASGFAGAGYINAYCRIDCTWVSGLSGGVGTNMRSRAQATDFVITGPSGPSVSGTLNLRLLAGLDKGGGYPWPSSGHSGRLFFDVRANNILAQGTYDHGNFASSGSGYLAGLTNPNLDVPVTITGSFPVGSPFNVNMFMEAGGSTYGNVSVSPAFLKIDEGGLPGDNTGRGLMLEEVNGQVMTLPAGYTLNSPSWGVVDNRFTNPVGVEYVAPGADLRLLLAGANPSSGETRVALSVPRDGLVRVVLFDVAGRVQRTLFDGWQSAGTLRIDWDGRTAAGSAAPVGLYFIRAESEGQSVTRAIVRVK